jgi:hypothetical protein
VTEQERSFWFAVHMASMEKNNEDDECDTVCMGNAHLQIYVLFHLAHAYLFKNAILEREI